MKLLIVLTVSTLASFLPSIARSQFVFPGFTRDAPYVYEGSCLLSGDIQQSATTQETCQSGCEADTTCVAFEFFSSTSACYFYTEADACNVKLPIAGCNHFTYISCVSCVTTSGGNGNNENCVFPFTWRGVTYTECTDESYFAPWCAVSPQLGAGNNRFGICGADECPVTTTTVPTTTTMTMTSTSTSSMPSTSEGMTTTSTSAVPSDATSSTMMDSTSTTSAGPTATTTTLPSTTAPTTSADPNSCVTSLVLTEGVFSPGGIQQDTRDEETCKLQCIAQSGTLTCLGMDFNTVLELCYFFFDPLKLETVNEGADVNHYVRVTECPQTTTNPLQTCVDTFEVYEERHAFDADVYVQQARDQQSCEFACIRRPRCRSYDFNTQDHSCFLFERFIPDDLLFEREEINHYRRIPCLTTTTMEPTTTTTLPTTTTTPGCIDTFDEIHGYFATGGIPLPDVATSADCRAVCLSVPQCRSIDFDYNNTESHCFWHNRPQLRLRTPAQPNIVVNHYVRIDCNIPTPNPDDVMVSNTRGGCVDHFEEKIGVGSFFGTPKEDVDRIGECRRMCLSDDACGAFDYVPRSPQTKCFIHYNVTLAELESRQYLYPEVYQYVRITCAITVTTPTTTMPTSSVETTPSMGPTTTEGCVPAFREEPNTYAEGGIVQAAFYNTRDSCGEKCLETEECAGFNFDNITRSCEILTMDTVFELRQRNGVSRYLLIPCDLQSTTRRDDGQPTECVDTFNVTRNTNRQDGSQLPGTFDSAGDCENACRRDNLCFSFDYNLLTSLCFIFNTPDRPELLGEAIAIDHYVRIPCRNDTGPVTTPMPTVVTTQSPPGCVERYNRTNNTFTTGGMPVMRINTSMECANLCSNDTSCVAFDFITRNVSANEARCFIHNNMSFSNPRVNDSRAVGTNQYVRIRCINATSTTMSMNVTMSMTTTRPMIPCMSNPCFGNAECRNSEDMMSFTCICPGGFTGPTCADLCPNRPSFPWGMNFWNNCTQVSALLMGERDMMTRMEASMTCARYGGDLVDIFSLNALANFTMALNRSGFAFMNNTEMWVMGNTSLPVGSMITDPRQMLNLSMPRPNCVVLRYTNMSWNLYSANCSSRSDRVRLCMKIDGCPPLFNPAFGLVQVTSARPGIGIAQYTCADFYEPSVSNGTSFCTNNRTWFPPPSTCVRPEGECPNDAEPLQNEDDESIFCGIGQGRQNCSDGYYCNVVSPLYAVCCPDDGETTTRIMTPSTPSSSMMTSPTTTMMSRAPNTTNMTTTTVATMTTSSICISRYQTFNNLIAAFGNPAIGIDTVAGCEGRCNTSNPTCFGFDFVTYNDGEMQCLIHFSEANFDDVNIRQVDAALDEVGSVQYRRVFDCSGTTTDPTAPTVMPTGGATDGPGTCVGTYDRFDNRNRVSAGIPVPGSPSLVDCQRFCTSLASCNGLTYVTATSVCQIYQTSDMNTVFSQGTSYYPLIDRNCDDPCTPNPCMNNGQCAVTGSTFECTCAEGFTGNICDAADSELNIDFDTDAADDGNCQFAVLPNLWYSNGTLQETSTTPEACFNLCQLASGCVAAKFNKTSSQCYFSSEPPTRLIAASNVLLFAKDCGMTCSDGFIRAEGYQASNPTATINRQVASEDDCANECRDHGPNRCEAFQYSALSSTCQLFEADALISSRGMTQNPDFNFYGRNTCVDTLNANTVSYSVVQNQK